MAVVKEDAVAVVEWWQWQPITCDVMNFGSATDDAGSGGAGVANTTTPGLLALTARLYNSDSTPAAEQTKVRFEVAVGAQNRAMTFACACWPARD